MHRTLFSMVAKLYNFVPDDASLHTRYTSTHYHLGNAPNLCPISLTGEVTTRIRGFERLDRENDERSCEPCDETIGNLGEKETHRERKSD